MNSSIYFAIKGSRVYHEMHCGCETFCGLRVMEEEGEHTRKTKPRGLRFCRKCEWEKRRV